jgi:hypothetical protein
MPQLHNSFEAHVLSAAGHGTDKRGVALQPLFVQPSPSLQKGSQVLGLAMPRSLKLPNARYG